MDAGINIDYVAASQNVDAAELRTAFDDVPAYTFDQLSVRSEWALADRGADIGGSVVARSSDIYVQAVARSTPSTSGVFVSTISPIMLPGGKGPTAMHVVMETVRPLAQLPAGWDGYGGVAPSAQAIDDAERFVIAHLFAFEQRLPEISPASDGEVNFCWRSDGGLLDLGFYGDGTYSYYAKLKDGREFIDDAAPVDARLPTEVMTAICHS